MSKMKKMFKFSTKNKNADPSEWSKNDEKLQAAILGDDYEKADLLISKKGISPVKVNPQGLTTLHRVAGEGKLEALQFLHQKEVDLSTVDSHGQTPLHCAAQSGHVDTVKYLLQSVPDCLSALDHNDLLPLHHACMGGNMETVRLLLNAGSEVDAKDRVGRTSLFMAARLGNQALVKELLDHHANIDHRDLDRKTALICATEYEHLEVVDYLVKRGANVLLTDSAGHNAYWYADERLNDALKEIIDNAPSHASWNLDVAETRSDQSGPTPDSADMVAKFVPEPEENSPPPRPVPPSRKSKHAPRPPPPTKAALSPPPGFQSGSPQQLHKLENAVVPMDEAPDDVEEVVQVARVSETFELNRASSNPIIDTDDNNFGRFSPEAVAAVEALIEQSNSGNTESSPTLKGLDQVDSQAYKELEEENECLNDEIYKVSREREKLQEKVNELERKLSESDQEGSSVLTNGQLAEAREQLAADKERMADLEDEVKNLRKHVDIDSKPEAERNADDSWNDSDDDLFESELDAKKKLPGPVAETAVVASLRSQIFGLEKELEETKESVESGDRKRPVLMPSESTTERELEAMNHFSELQQAHDVECQQLQSRIEELMDENFLIKKELSAGAPQSGTYTETDQEELHQLVDMIGAKVNANKYGSTRRGTVEEELQRLQEYAEQINQSDNTDQSEDTKEEIEEIQKKYERSLRDLARAKADIEELVEKQKSDAELEEIQSQVESLTEISQYNAELQQENDTLKAENKRLLESDRSSPGEQDQKAMAMLTMQLQQENNDLKSDNRSLKSQLSEIETSLKDTLSQREQENLQVNPLEEENMSLKLEIESLRRVVSKDMAEGSALGEQTELLSQISHLKKTISQQEETIFELMQQSTRDAQLRADYERLQKESEVLNSSMADFQNQMANKSLETEHHVKKLEEAIELLENENTLLKQLQNQQKFNDNTSSEFETELRDRIAELLTVNELLEEENGEFKQEMAKLDVHSKKVESLQQEKEHWEDEKVFLERKLNEAEENAKLWSVRVEGLQMENESFKQDKENLLKDVTRWQEEALQLQSDVTSAAAERINQQHIQDEYNALKEVNESLERKLRSSEAAVQDDTSYRELKSKVRDLEEKLESEQNATVMAILDGRTEEQKNTEENLKAMIEELSKENEKLKKEIQERHGLQQNGNGEERIELVEQVSLQASKPNGHLDNYRLGSSLKRRSEEMRLKEVEEENEKLKTDLEKLRNSPHTMQVSAANQHMHMLQEKFEHMEKRHRDVVSTYRTHLLKAVQGRMDSEVSQALKNIIKIRSAPEVDV